MNYNRRFDRDEEQEEQDYRKYQKDSRKNRFKNKWRDREKFVKGHDKVHNHHKHWQDDDGYDEDL